MLHNCFILGLLLLLAVPEAACSRSGPAPMPQAASGSPAVSPVTEPEVASAPAATPLPPPPEPASLLDSVNAAMAGVDGLHLEGEVVVKANREEEADLLTVEFQRDSNQRGDFQLQAAIKVRFGTSTNSIPFELRRSGDTTYARNPFTGAWAIWEERDSLGAETLVAVTTGSLTLENPEAETALLDGAVVHKLTGWIPGDLEQEQVALWVGADDRLVRRFQLDQRVPAGAWLGLAPPEFTEVFQQSIFRLSKFNQPVRVEAPPVSLTPAPVAPATTSTPGQVLPNPLAAAPAQLDFYRAGTEAGTGGVAGAAWLDYDNDGLLDLFIPNGKGNPNGLFHNNDDGTFTDVAEAAGVANGLGNSGALAGDINNDGCADLFLTGEGASAGLQSPTRLYLNDCDGAFSDITDQAGVPGAETALGAAFGDIDNDGFLDLFIASPGSFPARARHKNKLYRNNGDLTFTDISQAAGVDTALGACVAGFSDYNDDGWPDLFVGNCNDLLFSPTPIELFRNNGDLTFTDATVESGLDVGGFWMGIAFGDYDGDGDTDVFSTNAINGMGGVIPDAIFPHALYENKGDGSFSDVGAAAGVANWEFGWGASFADFDNDGDIDLFFTGSLPPPPFDIVGPGKGNPGRLFLNNGDKTFSLAGTYGLENRFTSGVATGDYDNNGFPDVVVVTGAFQEQPGRPLLLQNAGNDNHWITVKTVGTASNRGGVGARVKVTAADLAQVKEARAGSSFMSTDSPWLTFGLGQREWVDIEVRWPSGLAETFPNQEVNQTLTLVEGAGVPGK